MSEKEKTQLPSVEDLEQVEFTDDRPNEDANEDQQTAPAQQTNEVADNVALEQGPVVTEEDEEPVIPPNLVKGKSRPWLPYVITAAVLVVLTLLVAWAEGGYKRTETWLMLARWGSAIAVAGVFGVAAGLLVWLSNGGAFDIFVYGARSFARMFARKYTPDKKYRTYYDYHEARKKAKKRSFLYMVIVGGAFFLIGGVLLLVSNSLMPA